MKLPVSSVPTSRVLSEALRSLDRDALGARLILTGIGPDPDGKYRHWDTLRHLAAPPPLTAEQYWAAIKLARLSIYQRLPLTDGRGDQFVYALPPSIQEQLHFVDRDAGRLIGAPSTLSDSETRATFLLRSLIEEAITSSQLEGASTTRRVAKDMILAGRSPRNRSERMIMNNYHAMQHLRQIRNDPLTASHVLELQRILTEGTLDDETGAGRFRTAAEDIVIEDETGTLLHRPPPAAELRARLERLVSFANGTSSGGFMHPVVRAILVHFGLAYDHPFIDGNGRTARALFYWVMAREGYWLCEYVSISGILKKARAQYARSYLYTETDDNDATYFISYQLRTLNRAIKELHAYITRKTDEHRAVEDAMRRMKGRATLNHRQLDLLSHALKYPRAEFTFRSHQTAHGVAYATARTDLQYLAKRRLLAHVRRGRKDIFTVPENLPAMLEERASSAKS